MQKLTRVTINEGDAYDFIWVDGRCLMEGDYYHDKVSEKWEGIKEYLNFMKIPFEEEEIELTLKSEDKDLYEFDYQAKEKETLEKYLKRTSKFLKREE